MWKGKNDSNASSTKMDIYKTTMKAKNGYIKMDI